MSMRVAWKAGDMKSSPVPLFVRMAKCTQNQKRYTTAGIKIKPKALARKCFPTYCYTK